MFNGRNLVIATKHSKEKVIAPVMKDSLGLNCVVPENFDSDRFGTFSGEVERTDDPITTAKNKCLLAMNLSGCDLGLASEGSFGPHPLNAFLPSDEEILVFIDQKNGLNITVSHLSVETNFNGTDIKDLSQLKDFAASALFPSHGLIVKKSKDEFDEVEKGITDWKKLSASVDYNLSKHGTAYVETDMRALYNPTRMKVIEEATKKLVSRITSTCPKCNFPGFGITDVRQGLPCGICYSPTRSILSHIYSCEKCNYSMEKKYPNNKQTEDPRFCDLCNP